MTQNNLKNLPEVFNLIIIPLFKHLIKDGEMRDLQGENCLKYSAKHTWQFTH